MTLDSLINEVCELRYLKSCLSSFYRTIVNYLRKTGIPDFLSHLTLGITIEHKSEINPRKSIIAFRTCVYYERIAIPDGVFYIGYDIPEEVNR